MEGVQLPHLLQSRSLSVGPVGTGDSYFTSRLLVIWTVFGFVTCAVSVSDISQIMKSLSILMSTCAERSPTTRGEPGMGPCHETSQLQSSFLPSLPLHVAVSCIVFTPVSKVCFTISGVTHGGKDFCVQNPPWLS